MTNILDIQYVRFSVTDLAEQRAFLDAFGMVTSLEEDTLIARGTDGSPYSYLATRGDNRFLGIGFTAASPAALDRIAAIDGADVAAISDLPGGGQRVRMTDPDGFQIDVVCGQSSAAVPAVTPRSPLNNTLLAPRRGERVSMSPERHIVKRLGHCVINVTDFRQSETWYKQRLGLITSDEIYLQDESQVLGAFMRLDRGEEFVDHHTLFCVGAGAPSFNHAAFEVFDWDTLMQGHDRLVGAGYEHRWGVGKHILGSQVFDYWRDAHDFTLEHFTDGDLFNAEFGSHKQPIEQLLGVHWGPEGMP